MNIDDNDDWHEQQEEEEEEEQGKAGGKVTNASMNNEADVGWTLYYGHPVPLFLFPLHPHHHELPVKSTNCHFVFDRNHVWSELDSQLSLMLLQVAP